MKFEIVIAGGGVADRSGYHKLLMVDDDLKLCGILSPVDFLSRKEVIHDS